MTFSLTLAAYLARRYTLTLGGFVLAMAGIMALFDSLELLRRISKFQGVDFGLMIQMTLLKIPENIQLISPFAVLFATMYLLSQLTQRQELVIMRTAGASLWQILGPLLAVVFTYGILLVTILNPLQAATQSRYQHMEERYLKKEQALVSLVNQGLWLRQSEGRGYLLLHARTVDLKTWSLGEVSAMFFHPDHRFIQRIDSSSARLEPGMWRFGPSAVTRAGAPSENYPNYGIPTHLTAGDIQESFAAPETISFWQMPEFIRMLRATGFATTPLLIHYGALWALPLLLSGLILMATLVSIHPSRRGGQTILVVMGIIIGFVVFFATNFLHALGSSEQIPVLLAVAAPALLTLAIGTIGLLALEE